MHEIGVASLGKTRQQRAGSLHIESVPAHVRYGSSRAFRKAGGAAGDDPEATSVAFLRSLIQQLHAQTNAEHRLPQGGYHGIQAAAAKSRHGVRGGPHSGKNHMACCTNSLRIRRDDRSNVESLQGELQ